MSAELVGGYSSFAVANETYSITWSNDQHAAIA
jgi:hypothetical protein